MLLLAAIRNTGAYLSLAMKVRSSEYEVKDDKIHQRNQNIFLEIEAWISIINRRIVLRTSIIHLQLRSICINESFSKKFC